MRLIDADALEIVLGYLWVVTTPRDTDDKETSLERAAMCRGIDECVGIVQRSPAIGGWISVRDALPTSVANKVLVWLEHEDLNGYIGFGHYEKYKEQEIWFDLEHNEPFSIRGYTVTHWMPLPQAPKEEKQV